MNSDSSRTKLRISKDPMYLLLREGCIKEFNAKKATGTNAISEHATYGGLIFGGLMRMDWTSAIAISDNPICAVWT